jgi:hypothetical protein
MYVNNLYLLRNEKGKDEGERILTIKRIKKGDYLEMFPDCQEE